jgi:hypothetical protein
MSGMRGCQTERKFRTRYKEHIRDIRSNKENTPHSEYRSHIWDTGRHTPSSENTKQRPTSKFSGKIPHLQRK